MPLLDILLYPHPALKRKSVPVKNAGPEMDSLLDDMAETMRAADGVGLAAPQVGRNVRALVVDVPRAEGEERDFFELLNPQIVSAGGFQSGNEGCLSVPGVFADVRRKRDVVVSALDRKGGRFTVEAGGMLSRVLQHEIDHLDGILFFDRLGKLKRDLLLKEIDRRFAASAD